MASSFNSLPLVSNCLSLATGFYYSQFASHDIFSLALFITSLASIIGVTRSDRTMAIVRFTILATETVTKVAMLMTNRTHPLINTELWSDFTNPSFEGFLFSFLLVVTLEAALSPLPLIRFDNPVLVQLIQAAAIPCSIGSWLLAYLNKQSPIWCAVGVALMIFANVKPDYPLRVTLTLAAILVGHTHQPPNQTAQIPMWELVKYGICLVYSIRLRLSDQLEGRGLKRLTSVSPNFALRRKISLRNESLRRNVILHYVFIIVLGLVTSAATNVLLVAAVLWCLPNHRVHRFRLLVWPASMLGAILNIHQAPIYLGYALVSSQFEQQNQMFEQQRHWLVVQISRLYVMVCKVSLLNFLVGVTCHAGLCALFLSWRILTKYVGYVDVFLGTDEQHGQYFLYGILSKSVVVDIAIWGFLVLLRLNDDQKTTQKIWVPKMDYLKTIPVIKHLIPVLRLLRVADWTCFFVFSLLLLQREPSLIVLIGLLALGILIIGHLSLKMSSGWLCYLWQINRLIFGGILLLRYFYLFAGYRHRSYWLDLVLAPLMKNWYLIGLTNPDKQSVLVLLSSDVVVIILSTCMIEICKVREYVARRDEQQIGKPSNKGGQDQLECEVGLLESSQAEIIQFYSTYMTPLNLRLSRSQRLFKLVSQHTPDFHLGLVVLLTQLLVIDSNWLHYTMVGWGYLGYIYCTQSVSLLPLKGCAVACCLTILYKYGFYVIGVVYGFEGGYSLWQVASQYLLFISSLVLYKLNSADPTQDKLPITQQMANLNLNGDMAQSYNIPNNNLTLTSLTAPNNLNPLNPSFQPILNSYLLLDYIFPSASPDSCYVLALGYYGCHSGSISLLLGAMLTGDIYLIVGLILGLLWWKFIPNNLKQQSQRQATTENKNSTHPQLKQILNSPPIIYSIIVPLFLIGLLRGHIGLLFGVAMIRIQAMLAIYVSQGYNRTCFSQNTVGKQLINQQSHQQIGKQYSLPSTINYSHLSAKLLTTILFLPTTLAFIFVVGVCLAIQSCKLGLLGAIIFLGAIAVMGALLTKIKWQKIYNSNNQQSFSIIISHSETIPLAYLRILLVMSMAMYVVGIHHTITNAYFNWIGHSLLIWALIGLYAFRANQQKQKQVIKNQKQINVNNDQINQNNNQFNINNNQFNVNNNQINVNNNQFNINNNNQGNNQIYQNNNQTNQTNNLPNKINQPISIFTHQLKFLFIDPYNDIITANLFPSPLKFLSYFHGWAMQYWQLKSELVSELGAQIHNEKKLNLLKKHFFEREKLAIRMKRLGMQKSQLNGNITNNDNANNQSQSAYNANQAKDKNNQVQNNLKSKNQNSNKQQNVPEKDNNYRMGQVNQESPKTNSPHNEGNDAAPLKGNNPFMFASLEDFSFTSLNEPETQDYTVASNLLVTLPIEDLTECIRQLNCYCSSAVSSSDLIAHCRNIRKQFLSRVINGEAIQQIGAANQSKQVDNTHRLSKHSQVNAERLNQMEKEKSILQSQQSHCPQGIINRIAVQIIPNNGNQHTPSADISSLTPKTNNQNDGHSSRRPSNINTPKSVASSKFISIFQQLGGCCPDLEDQLQFQKRAIMIEKQHKCMTTIHEQGQQLNWLTRRLLFDFDTVGLFLVVCWNLTGGVCAVPANIAIFGWALVLETKTTFKFWLSLLIYAILIMVIKITFLQEGLTYELVIIWVCVAQISLIKMVGTAEVALSQRESIHGAFYRIFLNKLAHRLEQPNADQFLKLYIGLSGSERGSSFFYRVLGKNRLKPGKDFYPLIAILQLLVMLFIFFLFDWMEQEALNASHKIGDLLTVTKFSKNMIIVLFCHIVIMVAERFIVSLNISDPNNQRLENYLLNFLTREDNRYEPPNETACFHSLDPMLMIKYLSHTAVLIVINFLVYWYIPSQGMTKPLTLSELAKNPARNVLLSIFMVLELAYLFLSGLQVKHGLNRNKCRNRLMEKFTYPHYYLFLCFTGIPFLWEFKKICDWTVTATALPLFHWMKFEDIHSRMYQSKCQAEMLRIKPVGTPPNKPFVGPIGCFGIIALFFCPFIIYSPLNPFAIRDSILGCHLALVLTVDSYTDYRFFQTSHLTAMRIEEQKAQQFHLSDRDLYYIEFSSEPDQSFLLSDPLLAQLSRQMHQQPVKNRFELHLKVLVVQQLGGESNIGWASHTLNSTELVTFSKLIGGQLTSMVLSDFYSPYPRFATMETLTIKIASTKDYYEVMVGQTKGVYIRHEIEPKYNVSISIVAFYLTYVLLAGRLFRFYLTGGVDNIIYEGCELDQMLVLCDAVRQARILQNFTQQQYLYSTLIDLMRSPNKIKAISGNFLALRSYHLQKAQESQKAKQSHLSMEISSWLGTNRSI